MSITGQKFLITGGASLIGSHLTRALLAAGAAEVLLYDNLSLGSAALLGAFGGDGRVRSIRGDVLRLPHLLDAVAGVSGIFALAGYLTLPFSENPAAGADVNVMGMINTLEAARLSGPRRVVFASSVAVYGGDVEGVVDESRAFRAADISAAAASYGASKLLGESLGRLYAERYGVDFCALRFTTVYGERQHARGINALYILEAMQAARAGRRVVVRGSGDEAHDYLYAGDAARACVRAMDSPAPAAPSTLRPGDRPASTTSSPWCARNMARPWSRSTSPIRERCDRRRTTRCTFPRHGRRKSSGWEPAVALREGIARLRRWLDAPDV